METRRGLAVLTAAVVAMGTWASGAGSAGAQECENPDVLRFSIIPTEETAQEVALYEPVIDYLSEQTGKEIEFYMPTSYASVIEAMLGGWVDIAVHGPNSYVIANEEDPTIEVFATYAKKPGHLQEEGPGYQAVLITKKGSGFTDIGSLKGAVLGLTDPASTSGNLLPRVAFTPEIGNKELEDYFSNVVYTGGHDLSTIAVFEGKVDAGFVATHRFDNVVDRGMVKLDDFNVIWRSTVIPQDPFTYRGALCPDLKEKIRNTFLTLHKRPEAKSFLENVNSNKFVPMQDADYNIIRELAAKKESN
ncbi:phosphate/phosphite/phosphonate ABC transporter substrate-binding protein [Rhodospirillaceae bacterium SYSU D60014]|uniref:phosphate/phosphite/phosphonate ABC transporter substrate-binding protein n=1 Tax=Virgifigura deserti TaxID=2268457 RepID=UPI000E66C938